MYKAMVMSAGVGSRLDPLTKSVPKPLVPICNKPVMDILLENLKAIGVKDVVANTFYLAEQIVARYIKNDIGINFNYITEESLSGTAGGVKKCQFFFNEGEDFFVLSADGVTNADLMKGMEIHKNSGAIATIGVKPVKEEDIPNFGVVVTDSEGFITEFQEKPAIKDAKSNLINTGIYIFNYKIFDYIPVGEFCDFANSNDNINIKKLYKSSILYLYNNTYFLVIDGINLTNHSLLALHSNLLEFSILTKYTKNFKFKLKEHGKVIIKNNAINTGMKYFSYKS